MTPRGARPSILFDQAAAPLGQDASGRYYLVRLTDDPAAARVLKRFDHVGWRSPAARLHLSQQLWRLGRLGRPELPGFSFIESIGTGADPDETQPCACVVAAPGPRSVADSLPLGAAEAVHLVGLLADTLWAAHGARVAGLRFDPAAVARDEASGWRWLAPDLLPPTSLFEAACREDLQALARFARQLVAAADATGDALPAGSLLASVVGLLAAAEPTAAAALQAVFTLLGQDAPPLTLPAAAPLMGWDSELEMLGAWLRKCTQEQRLHLLWLSGEPGSLQWDLCEALAAQVRPAGMRVVIARCQAEHSPEEFLAGVVAKLVGILGEEPGPDSAARALLDAPPSDLPPGLARLRLLSAFRRLLQEVAERTPVCLAWLGFEGADGLIRDLVEHLREEAAGLQVLLLLGHEPGREGATPLGPDADEESLHLRPLFRAEVERLARAHCAGLGLGLAALDAAWAFSGGQASEVYRLCLHWLRRGGLRQDAAGTWVPRDAGPRRVPIEDVREFLRAFATCGAASTLLAMKSLMDLPIASFFELLEAALDGGWLRQEPGWLAFWRPDEGRAFADDLPPVDALRWHRRLAAVVELPAATRAFHAARGGQDALATPLALDAGQCLLARGALEAAAGQFILGLELVQDDAPLHLALTDGLANVLLAKGEPAEALALLEKALGEPFAVQARAQAQLAALQGQARRHLGDDAGARSAYERALAGLDLLGLPQKTRVMLALADLAYERGERERGQAFAADARALAGDDASRVLQAEAHLGVGQGALMGPRASWSDGLAELADAVALGEATGQLEVVALAHTLTAQAQRAMDLLPAARACNEARRGVLRVLGRPDEAEEATLLAAWIALQLGDFEAALGEVGGHDMALEESIHPKRWVKAIAVRAVASLYLGYVNDPLRLLEQALRTARSQLDEVLELAVVRELVKALLFLGKLARAEEVCQSGLGLAATLGDRGAELGLRNDLAELAWRQGDRSRAHRLYHRVRDEAGDISLVATQARAVAGLAGLAYHDATYVVAQELAAEAMRLASRAGHPLLMTEICLLEGDIALARDDRPAATASFTAARNQAERMGSPHFRALVLFGLGQAISDPAEARALLGQASAHINVYLEQLTVNGRKDFLSLPERRRIVDVRTDVDASGQQAAGRSLSGTRSALFELLKQGQGSSWGAWQDSLSLLDEIFALVTSRLPLEDLIVRMNETFVRISQASRGLVLLANEDGELKLRDSQLVNERRSAGGAELPLPEALARVGAHGTTLWVPDLRNDPKFAALPDVLEQGLRGLLCIPLKVRRADGGGERVIGCLYGDRLSPWAGVGEKEVGLLELMARYISVTLEIGVLQDESSRKTHRLEMLNDLSRALAGTLDLERLLTLALTQIMRVSDGQQGYLFFGEDLKCRASLDQTGRVLTEIQVSRSVIERVARDRRPLTILDVGADEELQQKASLVIRNVRSVMCVPLVLDERLVGLIYVSSSTANKTFTRNDLDLMTAIAAQIALALQNAQAYEIIKELNQSLEAKVKARTAELEQAYRELQETQAQLLETEKLATIGTLAGGVAHEINNPLGAVLTNAQLLMDELTDPEQIDSLRMIEEGARRCKEIVSALLKYSKPAQASHCPVELRQVVAETLGLFERQLQQDGIQLEAHLDVDPTVMGDATELRQVLAHLLLNAVDAIREHVGPGGGRIAVSLLRELDGVRLTVEDNGLGMAPDVLKRIFDPFYTTKKVGSGTGLGLSVCQRVIDKHGGKLQAASTAGEGSLFTILLPAA